VPSSRSPGTCHRVQGDIGVLRNGTRDAHEEREEANLDTGRREQAPPSHHPGLLVTRGQSATTNRESNVRDC